MAVHIHLIYICIYIHYYILIDKWASDIRKWDTANSSFVHVLRTITRGVDAQAGSLPMHKNMAMEVKDMRWIALPKRPIEWYSRIGARMARQLDRVRLYFHLFIGAMF
jgi:hypothetical protein